MKPAHEPGADKRFSQKWVNLAEERLGTAVLWASDDFFAPKENLIKPGRGIFIPEKYTDRGKWMDGWESRRRRDDGHDACIMRLGARGVIRGVDIDTNHFTGNHPSSASIEACLLDQGDPTETTPWTEIMPRQPLGPGSQNLFDIHNPGEWSHLKLHIYPDGGVARFRVYGDVRANWKQLEHNPPIDLAALLNEGWPLSCSDMYFSNVQNLIAPGRGVNMGDGWETKRRRGPGYDWAILALGRPGQVQKVEVDTAHFKGNYPDSCSLEGLLAEQDGRLQVSGTESGWQQLLPQSKLQADHRHFYVSELLPIGTITHVRLNIYPDGGVSRLRVWGLPQ